MPEHKAARPAKVKPEPLQGIESFSVNAPASEKISRALQRARPSGAGLRASDIRALQRTAGNQAVQRLLAGGQAVRTQAPVPILQRDHLEDEDETLNRKALRPGDSAPRISSYGTAQAAQRDHLEDEDETLSRKALGRTESAPRISSHGTAQVARKSLAAKTSKNLGSARISGSAPGNHIQREGNWGKFKNYTKGIWGEGGDYRRENQWAMDAIDPRESYRSHAQKGGKWNKAKGVMAGAGHTAFGLPFALGGGALSTVGRGLETLGAGAYYGARGLGSMMHSGGKMAGRGLARAGRGIQSGYQGMKGWLNKDRNPQGYDRSRLPTNSSSNIELAKPGLALGISSGVGGGLEGANVGQGTPGGIGALNLLSFLDSLMTWRSGNKREEEARKINDLGGVKSGKRKANQGKWGVLGGALGTAQGGVNLANVMDVGSKGLMSFNDLAGTGKFVSTGLGVAGAGLGIAGGAITAGQGLWKSGKAISKLRNLGKSAPMLTEAGDRWRARIKDREKTKLGLNALKTIGGALGIAAGALVIASNPVGWALGIAGAAIVGGLFAYKLWNKYKKSRRKQKAKKEVRSEIEREDQEREQPQPQPEPRDEAPQDVPPVPNVGENVGVNGDVPEVLGGEQVNGEQQVGGEQGGPDESGMRDAEPGKLDREKRKKGVELGNRVAQKVSKSGKVAGEMREVLMTHELDDPKFGTLMSVLDKNMTHQELRSYNKDKERPFPQRLLKTHDAMVLMNVLNISLEEVKSESGQELIEKKLSAIDSL